MKHGILASIIGLGFAATAIAAGASAQPLTTRTTAQQAATPIPAPAATPVPAVTPIPKATPVPPP